MRQVSKEEFYGPVYRNRLNIHPRIVNATHPYTSVFHWLQNPNRKPYGKIIRVIEGGLEKNSYFVDEEYLT